jgi:ankyrin repeat protein
MKRLLEKGADANQTDEFGRTCLHLACNMIHRRDMKGVIKLLMKHDADSMAIDMKKRTPMHYMFIQKNRRNEMTQFEPMDHGLELLMKEKTQGRININQ